MVHIHHGEITHFGYLSVTRLPFRQVIVPSVNCLIKLKKMRKFTSLVTPTFYMFCSCGWLQLWVVMVKVLEHSVIPECRGVGFFPLISVILPPPWHWETLSWGTLLPSLWLPQVIPASCPCPPSLLGPIGCSSSTGSWTRTCTSSTPTSLSPS